MTHALFQVDAFTQVPFAGNPAAVCLLSEPADEDWMQNLAAEMNLSETAFLLLEDDGWRLRWFTPTTEVDLCGHATLASAFVLFTQKPQLRESALLFHTRSGELRARWVEGAVELDFPAMQPQPYDAPLAVTAALGIQPLAAVVSGDYYLFEVAEAQLVRELAPDFLGLRESGLLEVMVTATSDTPDYDFISRFFAPLLGVDEDPVTGSAHCLLTPFWADRLGRRSLRAYQASARGGSLDLKLQDGRVLIRGAACMIFDADLSL
jgi:PhzF family phenazine biosynthesis protein